MSERVFQWWCTSRSYGGETVGQYRSLGNIYTATKEQIVPIHFGMPRDPFRGTFP
jgi:hypothetical protein